MANTRNISHGKTCPAPSRRTAARTSGACSKRSAASKTKPYLFLCLKNGQTQEKSWEKVFPSLGVYSTRSTGDCPNAENVSTLSQILQRDVPDKYYLSPKACQGILRRASARGKALPPVLQRALERQSCV